QRGVGKTTLARLLAKALNCQNGPAPEPCGECDSCREVAAGRSVDVLEIDAASNRGIDAVRELRENARYAPARDRYKVFIIDEAHQITPEGFNALLKTLEEPPPHVIFILATTEAHQLPDTILSRCQHFAFRAVPFPDIYAHLEKVCAAENVAADSDALAALAASGEGSLRDALSRLEQAIAAFGASLEGEAVRRLLGAAPSRMIEEVFAAVLAENREQVLKIVERLVEEGYQLTPFCSQLVRAARNLLVARVAGPEPRLLEASSEEIERWTAIAEQFSEESLMRTLGILLQLHQDLRTSMEPRFQMELGLLKLVDAERLVAIEDLLARLESGGAPVAAAKGTAPKPPAAPSSGPGPAPRPSPFEQDLARKRQGQSPPDPVSRVGGSGAGRMTTAGGESGEAVPSAASVALDEDMDAGEMAGEEIAPPPAASVAIPSIVPSREAVWVQEVLRRLEESSKPMLASLVSEVERWEFGETEVRIRLAENGIARALPDADRQLLDRLVTEVMGRRVRVQFAGDWRVAPDGSRPQAAGKGRMKTAGPAPDPAIESRVRGDPEVREFETLFGTQVTGIRRWRE
ncbi:MAG: polymerase tau subunit, partial [Acidobacteria bacterium]|nr:polymerase tau subunit [Acidobacteriota bacterium]